MTFDASAATPELSAAATRAPRQGYFWTTVEVALLRQHYPAGGVAACQPRLPGRKVSAIHGKAVQLGLSAPRGLTKGMRFARDYIPTPHLDAEIRALYSRPMKRGDIKTFAAARNLPEWWVSKRASTIGVASVRRARCDAWQPAELAILEEFAACTLWLLAKKLRAAGFHRTPVAVGVKLKRLGFDRTDPDTWTAPDLAKLLGINAATVGDWIARRGLKAEKHNWGHTGKWVLKRRAVREWIKANPAAIDLRKVDQVWFMDLAFGSSV